MTQRRSLALLFPCLLAFAACETQKGMLFVEQNQSPEIGDDGVCTVPAEKTEATIPRGVLDVAFDQPKAYFLYPLIKNAIEDSLDMSPEATVVYVDRAKTVVHPEPRLPLPDFGADCPTTFEEPLAFRLEGGDTISGAMRVLLPCHAQRIKRYFEEPPDQPLYPPDQNVELYYTVDFSVSGNRAGSHIESDPFRFPIRVCYGCLQLQSPDGSLTTPLCSTMPPENPYTGNPCNYAQDFGPVMCCSNDLEGGNGELICPAPGVPAGPMGP